MSLVSGSSLMDSFLFILGSLLFAFYLYQTKYFNYWRDQNIPFIEPNLVFGSVKNEVLKRKSWYDFSFTCYTLFKDKGIGGMFIFRKPALVVCNKDLIERILVKEFVHFQDRTTFSRKEILMQSLFMAKGERWKTMRYKLAPSFSSVKVKAMFGQILTCGDLICKRIYETLGNVDSVRIEPLVFEYTTEVIASCTVGVQLLKNPQVADKFKSTFKTITEFHSLKIIKFFIMTIFPNFSNVMRINFIDQSVNDFFTHLTEETIKYREKNHIQRNDFLQMLLDLKEKEVKTQLNRFCSNKKETNKNNTSRDSEKNQSNPQVPLSEGIETGDCGNIFTSDVIIALIWNIISSGLNPTMVTVNFAMFEIARNSLIQTKVQDEIDLVLRKHKGCTYEALRDMVYLDQVIQETMRIYSFSSFLIRSVTEPYRIPEYNLTLEKDTLVYIPIAAIQMDPEHYTSPGLFNPDRFEGNNYKSNPFFMPFGDGPRICISIKFALTIIKICLVKILHDYNVTISNKTVLPIQYEPDVFYPKVKGGTWLNFQERKTKT